MKKLFERKEMKYRLTAEQAKAFVKRLEPDLVPDQYPDYVIRSLYFDDQDWTFMRKSIEKPAYKEKLRLRRYETGNAFLELKKKSLGIVYKRRIDADDVNEDSISAKEIGNTLAKGIEPRLYVSYHRLAWTWKDDPDLRITLDDQIQYRVNDLNLDDSPANIKLFHEKEYILEIKSTRNFPLALVRTLKDLEIWPCSVSKAGMAYKQWKETHRDFA